MPQESIGQFDRLLSIPAANNCEACAEESQNREEDDDNGSDDDHNENDEDEICEVID